jgi:hypothetical protein
MKTKFLWVALLGSAALIAQAQAGGRYGGGGGATGGHFASSHVAPARGGVRPSFRSMPAQNFAGRIGYSNPRFSSVGMRSPSSAAFRQRSIASNEGAFVAPRRFTSITSNRENQVTRSTNRGVQAIGSQRGNLNRTGQIRNGNNLASNWRNHVFAQRTGNWHRDWDRGREHWWHGHRCRFINGSWFIFDFGFYPWGPYWPYDYYAYPYGYYPNPYAYDSGGYDPGYYAPGAYQGDENYDQNRDESSAANADSIVAAAQEKLSRLGYYRGEIDGRIGPATGRAIAQYQSKHGLPVTGYLTADTLEALGLPQVASQ